MQDVRMSCMCYSVMRGKNKTFVKHLFIESRYKRDLFLLLLLC